MPTRLTAKEYHLPRRSLCEVSFPSSEPDHSDKTAYLRELSHPSRFSGRKKQADVPFQGHCVSSRGVFFNFRWSGSQMSYFTCQSAEYFPLRLLKNKVCYLVMRCAQPQCCLIHIQSVLIGIFSRKLFTDSDVEFFLVKNGIWSTGASTLIWLFPSYSFFDQK